MKNKRRKAKSLVLRASLSGCTEPRPLSVAKAQGLVPRASLRSGREIFCLSHIVPVKSYTCRGWGRDEYKRKNSCNRADRLGRSAPDRGDCPERLRSLTRTISHVIICMGVARSCEVDRAHARSLILRSPAHLLLLRVTTCTPAHRSQLLMRFSWGMINELLKFGRFGKTVPRCASSTPSHLAIGTI